MNSAYTGFTITNAVPEEEKRRDRRVIYLRFLFAAVFLIASFTFVSEALQSEDFLRGFAEFSKNLSAFVATFFSMFSFSFGEFLVGAFLLFWLIYLILFIRRLIVKRRRMAAFMRFISLAVLTASIISLLFVSMWGLNYLSAPLSRKLGLEVKKTSPDVLVKATMISIEFANYYSGRVTRDLSGKCDFGSFSDMAFHARDAEIGLMRRFEVFKAPYCPIPKAVTSSKIMSYFGITGIYFPFTGESNVNTDYVASDLPFVMTHELSHRLGTAPEDEANFMAFLACAGSSDPDFIYSGYLSAYIYALNEVYALSPQAAEKIIALQSDKVLFDIQVLNEYLMKYEGPVSDAGEQINNTYLKSMGEADGVLSYGRMVDLLIAYYNSPLFSNKIPQ